jgi:hypothetical protein
VCRLFGYRLLPLPAAVKDTGIQPDKEKEKKKCSSGNNTRPVLVVKY